MRIISGKYRGKKLIEYSDEVTRPTTDRVRESVFNVLVNLIDISGVTVLDLFAGTGAYGLECHSRGANEVVFNDCDARAVSTIKANCKAINLDAQILGLDYKSALEKLKCKKFDLVFLDPPYISDFALQAIPHINLSENGIVIVESEKELEFPNFNVKVKKYGRAVIYFLKIIEPPKPSQ